MTHLEFLCKGSAFHKVKVLSANSRMIERAGDSETDWLAFQQVVADAIENQSEGYEVLHKHTTSMRSGEMYDSAVISWEN